MKARTISQTFKNWTKYLWDWNKLKDPKPGMVELDLTNFCNANCSWCCSWREHKKEKCEMNTKVFFRELDIAIKNGYGIVFTGGGDPTLHSHFEDYVNMVVDYLNQGLIPSFALVTNGIESEKARYFIEHTSEPKSWIRISLNYRKPSEALVKLFHDYPKRIGLQLIYGNEDERILCEQNKRLLGDFSKFVKMNHANHYDIPHSKTHPNNCIGRKMHRVVESDGVVAYCCQARGMQGGFPAICPVECRWADIQLEDAWEWNPFT